MKVKKVRTDSDTKMLLTFMLEGSVRQVCDWKVGGGFIGFG